jgi:hypothetical protein
MLSEDKYFRDLTKAKLWQRYCGFLDLSINEFMDIQEELLIDQIDRVADSFLGKKIMGNRKPKSVKEFRRTVPLTTYEDYEPYLSEQEENVLGTKPALWCHTAGRRGSFRWIPHSSEIVEKAVRSYLASCILASCSRKGEINIRPGFRLLTVVPPAPYTSGSIVLAFSKCFSSRIMPNPNELESTEFREAIKSGFQIAIKEGVDIIGTVASILVRMGEEFGQQARRRKLSASMLHPKVMVRFLRGWLYSKWEGRTTLPKDLWRPKGIIMGGLDTDVYKGDVIHYWGSVPYELYAGTEGLIYAMQAWNKKGMIFLHDMVFLEFIPYEELLKFQDDKHYQPTTVLLDEVEEGKLYEVVITHFYGMPLLRYRLNDIVRIVATKDEETGISLPQVAFQRRVGEVINLAALAHIDEKTLWKAIANTGVRYTDWVACKEYDQSQSFLRVYLELKEEREAAEVANMIDAQLKIVDPDYRDIDSYLSLQPVRVTLLSPGTFQRYTEERRKEGVDLARLKPAHISPTEAVVQRLLELSEVVRDD